MLSHVRPSVSKFFYFLLLIGIILRIFLSLYALQFTENPDMIRYKDWARISYLYGFADTYKTTHISFGTLANNMPPGTMYTAFGSYYAQLQVAKLINKITHTKSGSNIWINGPMVSLFIRIPSLLADLILTILIYLFVKNRVNEKNALIASSLFWFNPIVLYNSAVWGQMDAIINMFFYTSLLFCLNKKYFWSILMFLFSIFVKLSLLPMIIPLFALMILTTKSYLKLTIAFFSAFIIMLVFILPISLQPLTWTFNYFLHHSGSEITSITAFAFNFWWVVFRPWISIGKTTTLFEYTQISMHGSPFQSEVFLFLPLYIWGYLLFFITLVPFLYIIYKKRKLITQDSIMLIVSICAFLIFLFLPSMHERYLYPLFPLLATYIGITGKYIKIFLLLTLLNFINIYIVWHPMPLPILNRNLIINQNFQWIISILTVFCCLCIYFLSLKKFLYEKHI